MSAKKNKVVRVEEGNIHSAAATACDVGLGVIGLAWKVVIVSYVVKVISR